jgi:hypothetical protein
VSLDPIKDFIFGDGACARLAAEWNDALVRVHDRIALSPGWRVEAGAQLHEPLGLPLPSAPETAFVFMRLVDESGVQKPWVINCIVDRGPFDGPFGLEYVAHHMVKRMFKQIQSDAMPIDRFEVDGVDWIAAKREREARLEAFRAS